MVQAGTPAGGKQSCNVGVMFEVMEMVKESHLTGIRS